MPRQITDFSLPLLFDDKVEKKRHLKSFYAR